ncbi:flagellar basal body-associated protein FliL [Psychromonas sp. B3M02]|uniref:flagellar basal body-associated FliL family protein n=1 Tax=Psychromonas sp. B3M02 TaxID=2267226 RepID=UPI000DEAB523|nr:flagellar basal body-associated FliL family protein [Psychromonas sp. B3M02]RBW47774.1 flagellar basal body-associated protein FliL [Psychromonas sp. B3M02]
MAEEDAVSGDAPAGKKKLIIIIVAAVLVLIIAAAAVFFLFFSGDPESEDAAQQTPVEEVEKLEANYVPMPRPLVFNLMEGSRNRTAQIKVQLIVDNKADTVLVRKHIPLLESTLVTVFGQASVEQLRSPQGKNELRMTALEELNKATTMVEQRALIHTVLFTGFVLQ